MTGPRDLSGVWDAVYAAAYVAAYGRVRDSRGSASCRDESIHDVLARDAAAVADEAVKALHRVRGSEASNG